jgi:cytochrome bd-type quinol oxidase subunit 2
MAALFALGSLCFLGGSVAAQWASSPGAVIGVTFFCGSLMFTAAAYLQFSDAGEGIDRRAAAVQLAGTVLFNISTFAAMRHGLTTHEENARVWAPDAFGSIAFLVASAMACVAVRRSGRRLRRRSLPWWIAALNLLGSVAFGIAAVASLVEPSSGLPLSARIANAGTSLGAACFLAGALLVVPAATRERRDLLAAPARDAPGGAAGDSA